jgi:hypothetical protein
VFILQETLHLRISSSSPSKSSQNKHKNEPKLVKKLSSGMEKFLKSVSTTMIDTAKLKEMLSSSKESSSNEITTGAKSIQSSSEKKKSRTKRKTLARFEKQTVETIKSKQKADNKSDKMTDEKNVSSAVMLLLVLS